MTLVNSQIFIYTNFRIANNALKQDAEAGCRLTSQNADKLDLQIGTTYTTPQAFVVSQWELWGDGRRQISSMERLIGIYELLVDEDLECSIGTATQIAELIKCGYTNLLNLDEDAYDSLSKPEKAIISLTRRYTSYLKRIECVELTEIIEKIEPQIDFSSIFIDSGILLEEPYKMLFDRCETIQGYLHSGRSLYDLNEEVEFTLLRAEGSSIVEKAIFDECVEDLKNGSFRRVAIVGPEPYKQFALMKNDFCQNGAKCTYMDSFSYTSTRFGKFFMSVCSLIAMSDSYVLEGLFNPSSLDWVSVATDIALNPFSKIGSFDEKVFERDIVKLHKESFDALDLNTIWRSDRTLTANNALRDLEMLSESVSCLVSIFRNHEFNEKAFNEFKRQARSSFDLVDADLEIKAIEKTLSTIKSLVELDAPLVYAPSIVSTSKISNSSSVIYKELIDKGDESLDQNGSEGIGEVFFLSADAIMSMPDNHFDVTIFCDVSDGFLNAKSEVSSTAYLSERIGIRRLNNTMERARHVFSTAIRSCKRKFVCVFPALNSDSKENFTSFTFDEFIKTVLGPNVTSKDLVSGKFADDAVNRKIGYKAFGEEHVQGGAGKKFSEPQSYLEFDPIVRGVLNESKLTEVMSSATDISGNTLNVISPSSLETYLSCPYKWFMNYILSLSDIDEGHSALERGTFAHELLRRFYDVIRGQYGTVFFDYENEYEIRKIFDDVADSLIKEQMDALPGSGRFVTVSLTEKAEVDKLIDNIFDSVLALNQLPHEYDLAASEFSISPFNEKPSYVEFANFYINGKVDRINAAQDNESFYVLDYKGSLKDHDAGSDCFAFNKDENGKVFIDENSLPDYVQTLIYAQVLRKLGVFGKSSLAALYTSYKYKSGNDLLVGSYDSACSQLAEFSNEKSSVFMPFDEFLDLVEDAVSARGRGILKSVIDERPSDKNACKYCGYRDCARRL